MALNSFSGIGNLFLFTDSSNSSGLLTLDIASPQAPAQFDVVTSAAGVSQLNPVEGDRPRIAALGPDSLKFAIVGSRDAQEGLSDGLSLKDNALFRRVGRALFGLGEQSASEIAADPTLQTSDEGRSIYVNFVANGEPTRLFSQLQSLGLTDAAIAGSTISGAFPVVAIAQLAGVDDLQFARLAYKPITNVGSVTSQADAALNADVARATFGVDGTGVKVGVLSDSFNALRGQRDDIRSGDLPGFGNPNGFRTPVQILDDFRSPFNIDEGRAMAQLIHDVAPGAALAFHTAFRGTANFAQGILDLRNAGSDVIVDDVIYFDEPFFQDGPIAQAVDAVVNDGATYFSSAGNNARDSYESAFRPSIQTLPGIPGVLHDFDPGIGVDTLQEIFIPRGDQLSISFQWDSPFFSVSGGAGSRNDLDIYLLDSNNNIVARSDDNNIGRDALEILQFTNFTSSSQFNIAISLANGAAPGLLKYVYFSGGSDVLEFDTNSSTLFGHANADGAIAVGAAFFGDTPAFGQNPPLIEEFSSAGPTPVLFTTTGERLAEPDLRPKPEITAPDGANTTFFGQDIVADADSFPNFFGTSAAAPHAAAVAALLLDAVPTATPEQIQGALESTAIDMDDPFTPGFDVGFDFGTGAGLIQADAALQFLLNT